MGRLSVLLVTVCLQKVSIWQGPGIRNAMELKASSHTVGFGYGRAFFSDVRCQTVNATLWEVLAALFAGVRIAVAVVVELRPTHEVLQDQRVWLATHCDR